MSVEKVPKKISTGPFNEEEEMLPQLGVPAAAASLCGPVGRLGHLNCRHSISPALFQHIVGEQLLASLRYRWPAGESRWLENCSLFLNFAFELEFLAFLLGCNFKQIRQYSARNLDHIVPVLGI